MKIIWLILLFWTFSTPCCASNNHTWRLSGDILEWAIPATAFGATWRLKDWKGSQELAKGFMATAIITYGLKYAIQEQRPSREGHSFPSGHAAIAFFGSGFIHQHYGWQYAIPAYVAAGYVGYSRIRIKEHWTHDVIGGAAIGLLCSVLFTTSYQNCQFHPSLTPNSIALHCEGQF